MSRVEKEALFVELFAEDELDEPTFCADCGNEIELGDEVCWEPLPEVHASCVAPVHPGCAAKNGYAVLRI